MENVCYQLSDLASIDVSKFSTLKTSLVHLSDSYRRSTVEKGALHPEHIQALRDLKKRNDVVIVKPDKGSGVVLMDRSSYVSKMHMILSDATKFVKDPKQVDQSKKLHGQLSDQLGKLVSCSVLTSQKKSSLLACGQSIPRLYGLPKTHKSECPLRPILSMSGSPTHATSVWLADYLRPVREHFGRHCVRDSFTFASEIQQQRLSDVKMVSFDAQSLFTNVPVQKTIDVIIDTLSTEHFPNCDIPLDCLRELLELCTTNVQFMFDGVLFRQVDGCAMGSCLGPIFADIFLGFLELTWSDEIERSTTLYRRFVDDCFLLVPSFEEAFHLLKVFNIMHPSIKFTCELEQDNQLPFLDVYCQRRYDGTVYTSVYRKSTWTGLYTSYFSFVPRSYKAGLIRSLTCRAYRICSQDALESELKCIEDTLLCNGYPLHFIRRFMLPPRVSNFPEFGPEKKNVILKLPFIGDQAASFAKRSYKKLLSVFPAVKPLIVFQTTRIPVSSPKDKLPVSAQTQVIYAFSCTCGSRYVGRTGRSLKERMKEHVPLWLRKGNKFPPRSKSRPSSAVTRHLQTCTEVDFSKVDACFSVLFSVKGFYLLRIYEAISIKCFTPDLCTQKEFVLDLTLPWL